jgi:hypothetical protein
MPPFAGLAAAGNARAKELGQRRAPPKQEAVMFCRIFLDTLRGDDFWCCDLETCCNYIGFAIDVLLQEFSIRIVIYPVHVLQVFFLNYAC